MSTSFLFAVRDPKGDRVDRDPTKLRKKDKILPIVGVEHLYRQDLYLNYAGYLLLDGWTHGALGEFLGGTNGNIFRRLSLHREALKRLRGELPHVPEVTPEEWCIKSVLVCLIANADRYLQEYGDRAVMNVY